MGCGSCYGNSGRKSGSGDRDTPLLAHVGDWRKKARRGCATNAEGMEGGVNFMSSEQARTSQSATFVESFNSLFEGRGCVGAEVACGDVPWQVATPSSCFCGLASGSEGQRGEQTTKVIGSWMAGPSLPAGGHCRLSGGCSEDAATACGCCAVVRVSRGLGASASGNGLACRGEDTVYPCSDDC
mmetsp:Transcript_29182/g.76585  ORF Transcript_29182/g.76585 Transcript_29182/m.76585 type:complete len:184 (-) Transcript_29182:1497-2048(-)